MKRPLALLLPLVLASCTTVPVATRTAPTAPLAFTRTLVLAENAPAAALQPTEEALVAALPELHAVSAASTGAGAPPMEIGLEATTAWAEKSGADAVLVVGLVSRTKKPLSGMNFQTSPPPFEGYTNVPGEPATTSVPGTVIESASVRLDLVSVRERKVVWSGLATKLDGWPTDHPRGFAKSVARRLRADGVLTKG